MLTLTDQQDDGNNGDYAGDSNDDSKSSSGSGSKGRGSGR